MMLLLLVLLIAAPLPLQTVHYQHRHHISDDVIIRQQSFDDADDRLGQLQILDIAAGQYMHIVHDRNGIVACNHSIIDANQFTDSMINASSSVPITDQQSVAQIRQLGRDCAAQHRRRSKRFIFIAPGTYWCGMGNRAPTAQDIGPNSDIDRCCREHDACPYFIPRITNRYGYYNWRTHTLSYCTCDNRFHSCLKAAGTGSAELLGRFFFNVINRVCFDLKRDKVCAEYNWWGKCIKWKTGLVAQVQDTPAF